MANALKLMPQLPPAICHASHTHPDPISPTLRPLGIHQPKFSTDSLAPGTFYLESISTAYERKYSRVPLPGQASQLSPCVLRSNSRSDSLDEDMRQVYT